jgi:serine/threonine protein kinase
MYPVSRIVCFLAATNSYQGRSLDENNPLGPPNRDPEIYPQPPMSSRIFPSQNFIQYLPLMNLRTPGNVIEVGINGSVHGRNDSTSEAGMSRQIIAGPARDTCLSSSAVFQKDPYQHIDFLGSGAYGYVDTVTKVDEPSAVFARKTIRITSGRNRGVQLRSVEREFEILNRLKHCHVMRVLDIYCYCNKLSIIMSHVADTDMKEYLDKLDTLDTGPERHEMLKPLLMWQGCLIQAIDYLHEMKVKHKDLKPANILVKNGHIMITDFGIAKDLIDEETTQSLISGGTQGSPMYMAPEITLGGRRGRAVDIFSLGCIFLEISTCLIAGPGSHAKFAEHRNVNGSRAFSRCPTRILQWFWYLSGCYAEYNVFRNRLPDYPPDILFVHCTMLPGELAFMMLDPDPNTRITSRQLTQKIHSAVHLWNDVKMKACVECSSGPTWYSIHLPSHSSFKENEDLHFPQPPDIALTSLLNLDWEGAKNFGWSIICGGKLNAILNLERYELSIAFGGLYSTWISICVPPMVLLEISVPKF